MSLFFISAASGTGKTTLMNELRRRGEEAHDTDVECVRCSKATGLPISYEEAKRDGYDWVYPPKSLQKLKLQSHGKNVFLLGTVDNFNEVKLAADEYIWMTIPLDVLLTRLNTREKAYGKSPSERESILSLNEKMRSDIGPEVFTLDATKPVELIADDLLTHVDSRHEHP